MTGTDRLQVRQERRRFRGPVSGRGVCRRHSGEARDPGLPAALGPGKRALLKPLHLAAKKRKIRSIISRGGELCFACQRCGIAAGKGWFAGSLVGRSEES